MAANEEEFEAINSVVRESVLQASMNRTAGDITGQQGWKLNTERVTRLDERSVTLGEFRRFVRKLRQFAAGGPQCVVASASGILCTCASRG